MSSVCQRIVDAQMRATILERTCAHDAADVFIRVESCLALKSRGAKWKKASLGCKSTTKENIKV